MAPIPQPASVPKIVRNKEEPAEPEDRGADKRKRKNNKRY